MEFQVRYLVLLIFFKVKDSFKWLWMASLHKNIQLMLEFLNAPFLVLTFPTVHQWPWCYLWYCYLWWWYYSILSVIRHLICGSNYHWLPNLNLIYKTLWSGARSGLLILMLEKISWFHLTGLITRVLLMWNKWICSWGKIIF